MRLVLTLIWVILPNFALADDGFQQKKSRMVEQLELQVAELEKAKTCVLSASDMNELKKCRFQRRAGLKDLKSKLQVKYGNKPSKETSNKQNDTLEEELID